MDFCPLLSEDMGEIDPLVSPKTQMCAFNQTRTKSEWFFSISPIPSINYPLRRQKKMLKMVARIAFKRKQLQFPLWNSRGHQKYALLPAPSSRVT